MLKIPTKAWTIDNFTPAKPQQGKHINTDKHTDKWTDRQTDTHILGHTLSSPPSSTTKTTGINDH